MDDPLLWEQKRFRMSRATIPWDLHYCYSNANGNSPGAKLKKCVIKGDNWSVKGPTKNLYILTAEVVLMAIWSGVFPNQWEYYGLP